ncbi:MAG: TatD family hydrolase [Flavobacteriales bacterium]
MILIDTHTHLFSSKFDQDRHEVVKKAISKGVDKLLLPNINSSTIESMHQLCVDFPNHCLPMIGLHPCDVGENYVDEMVIIKKHLDKNKYVAIGEIGIDLYWDKSTLDIQKKCFRQQLNWAKEKQLPVAIHVRESFDEVFDVLEQLNDSTLNGVFHCFTGDENQANKAIEMGFKLGVGGVVTFKNSGLDKTLKQIPIEHIVLETDSPYLTPSPYRGQRNESAYLPIIAEKLAEIYSLDIKDIAKITTENAKNLFKL